MKEESKRLLRKRVIQRHRKKKNLCLKCGQNIHKGNCIEVYDRADMRSKEAEIKPVNTERRKKTILSYRKRKNLCSRCGKNPHSGDCIETWEKSDTRSEEEKLNKPVIVPTPKHKEPSILETLNIESNIEVEYKPKNKIKLQRPFVIINLQNSGDNELITYSCIEQLSRRYNDYILCLIGNLKNYFSYGDYLKIKNLTNITEVDITDKQTIIDYICSSEKLFTFPNIDYTPICIKYNIPIYEFQKGSVITNFINDRAFKI